MAFHNPFDHFQPKKKGMSLGGEFTVWEPLSHYAREEVKGEYEWKGKELEAIETKTRVPPIAPLTQIFGDLFSRIWVKANKPTTLQQKSFMALTRQGTQPARLPGQGTYVPAVAPTRTTAWSTINNQTPGATDHLNNIANDWQLHENLKRCTAYTFRGDGRDLSAIKSAGGFNPPSTRNDDHYIKGCIYEQFCSYMERRYGMDLQATMTPDQFLAVVRETVRTTDAKDTLMFYTNWRAIVQSEELHLGRMLAEETLKGYISTTKAVPIAKAFACNSSAKSGWVYCVAVLGGFVVPKKKSTQWTRVFGEQEIANAGALPWNHIAAARQVKDYKFTGDIYIRNNFERIDPKPFEKVYKLLSGKKQ